MQYLFTFIFSMYIMLTFIFGLLVEPQDQEAMIRKLVFLPAALPAAALSPQ